MQIEYGQTGWITVWCSSWCSRLNYGLILLVTLWIWQTPATISAVWYKLMSHFLCGLACWRMVSVLRRRHRSRVFFFFVCFLLFLGFFYSHCTQLGISSHWGNKTNKKGARMARRQKRRDYYVQRPVSATTSWVKLWWRCMPSWQIADLRQDRGVGVPCNYIIARLVLCRNVNSVFEWEHLCSPNSNGEIQRHVL